ncbi:MAG: patatin-like phospholipase family protein [Holophagales bacterium]|nr:patatin-like phospholipase family protein [Holophagales bacterium]
MPFPAFGQPATEKAAPRPRIGLVLSGGGARGAAHVGVLKVLEEIHVPVDLIAGASMGSIVGGLYATGMSPQEMEDALATMDWDASFEDKVPRKEMPFRRKFDESSFLTKIRIGIQDGHTALPTGLVEGQKLNFILRQLTLPSATVDDFDKLSIPFRATATDVASGEGIVLSHGNVADAMRASMAFPGLFSPVEIDGRLLVDGGVAENFPVETARKAGAEVLVAVNIGTPPAGKEKLTSLVKIINQVTNAATARNVRLSKAAISTKDVFIEPDLGDISFIDFKRVRDAVAAGEKAARAQIEELKRFSVPEAEYRAWRERTRRKAYKPFAIASIELVNPSPVSNAIVLSHVKTKPGPLDMKLLEEDLTSINSIGEFDLVDFRIVPRGDGNVLQIVIKDRAWARTSAQFGINLNSDFKGNNGFELLASVTSTSVNRLGAEWRAIAGVGEITTITGEFFQPVKVASPFFVSGVASWQTQTPLVPVEGLGTVGVQEKQYMWGAVAGVGDGRFWELRGGAQLGHLWTDPTTTEALQAESVSRGAVVARLTVDSRDNVPFPSKGAALRVAMDWETPALGADDSTRRLHGIGMAAFSSGKNVFQVLATGGSPVKTDLPYYDAFKLGGFRRLSGYTRDELYGPYMAFGSVTYLREINRFKTSIIGGAYYLGVSLEAGNVWKTGSDVSFSNLRYAGSVFVGIDSPLGPVYVAYGMAEGGRSAVTFQLGVAF